MVFKADFELKVKKSLVKAEEQQSFGNMFID